jgi:predicted PurR-regulated permease PerM
MEVNINFVIALIGIILAIFGSAWLNNQQLIKILTAHKDELSGRMEQMERRLDNRIDQLEKRFTDRFAILENRIEKIDRQLEQIFKPILPK